jgi:YbbR domain-containing protein
VAPGYWISGIVVQPAAVTFGGDPQVLESFGYVETAPVDITGAVTEVLKSVSIFTPPGTALDKKQDVFVKVSVEPFPGGGILRRPLTWRNLTRGITVTLSLSSVDIRMDGPVPDLLSLKPTDLVASIDLTGLLTGTYSLPVAITGVPTGTKVISVDPEKVGVGMRGLLTGTYTLPVTVTVVPTGTYTLPVTVTVVPTGTNGISVDSEKVGVSIR